MTCARSPRTCSRGCRHASPGSEASASLRSIWATARHCPTSSCRPVAMRRRSRSSANANADTQAWRDVGSVRRGAAACRRAGSPPQTSENHVCIQRHKRAVDCVMLPPKAEQGNPRMLVYYGKWRPPYYRAHHKSRPGSIPHSLTLPVCRLCFQAPHLRGRLPVVPVRWRGGKALWHRTSRSTLRSSPAGTLPVPARSCCGQRRLKFGMTGAVTPPPRAVAGGRSAGHRSCRTAPQSHGHNCAPAVRPGRSCMPSGGHRPRPQSGTRPG